MPELSDLGSVTINGYPVLVDVGGEVESYIQQYIPLSNLWPGPTVPRSIPPTGTGMDVFESPYPELPPCEIGQFQWPANMARYGRALYLVDKDTMTKLATDGWGYAPYEPPDPEAPPPEEGDPPPPPANTATEPFLYWGESSELEVTLELNTPEVYFTGSGSPPQTKIRVRMLMLLPIRITTASDDVWLLRLVDKVRFQSRDMLIYPLDVTGRVTGNNSPVNTSPATTEPFHVADDSLGLTGTRSQIFRVLICNYLRILEADIGISTTIDSGYTTTNVDPCFQWKGNRVVEVVDAMALSYGLKLVYALPTGTGNPRLFIQTPTEAKVIKTALFDATKSPIVGGGKTGRGWLPRKSEFSARRCEQYCVTDHFYRYECVTSGNELGFTGVDNAKPIQFFTLWNIHYFGVIDAETVWETGQTAFHALCLKLWQLHREWHSEQYDVSCAGFYRPIGGAGVPLDAPSGFDDYVCFCLRSGTTRYKSLPVHFVPRCVLFNGLEDICVFEDQKIRGVVREVVTPVPTNPFIRTNAGIGGVGLGGPDPQVVVDIGPTVFGDNAVRRNKPYLHFGLSASSPGVVSNRANVYARIPFGSVAVSQNVLLYRDRNDEWVVALWGCQ